MKIYIRYLMIIIALCCILIVCPNTSARSISPYYILQIHGAQQAVFSKVTGLDSKISAPISRRIIFSKGKGNRDLIIVRSKAPKSLHRQKVSIILMGDNGKIIKRWVLHNVSVVKCEKSDDAGLEKYHSPALAASGNEVAMETMEITHEGLEEDPSDH